VVIDTLAGVGAATLVILATIALVEVSSYFRRTNTSIGKLMDHYANWHGYKPSNFDTTNHAAAMEQSIANLKCRLEQQKLALDAVRVRLWNLDGKPGKADSTH
jgi:hypothetical protein